MSVHALSIAGSDSSGGAGIAADLKTFAAWHAYGMAVITAVTAQNTRGVQAIHPVPADIVAAQLRALREDVRIDTIKLGMTGSAFVVMTVAEFLRSVEAVPVVVDPVMLASTGAALSTDAAVDCLRSELLPLATVLTPNLPEAARLLDEPLAESVDAMVRQARRLLELGPRWVLLKGGHLPGASSVDVLVGPDGVLRLSGPRAATPNTHGTGCTLASAIAALLPSSSVATACRLAKQYVYKTLLAADRLQVGGGSGPVNHFPVPYPIMQVLA